MGKLPILVVLAIAMTAVGCAAAKQAKVDYEVGATLPPREGEKMPEDQAKEITDLVAVVSPQAAAVLGLLLTAIFRWKRGRAERKGKGYSKNGPITGHLGASLGLESLVQAASTLRAAVFDIGGPNQTVLRSVWTAALIGGAAFGIASLTKSDVIGWITVMAGAAANASLAKVLPVKEEEEPAATGTAPAA